VTDEKEEAEALSAASAEQEAWQNYGLSVIFVGIVPLLPILIEMFIGGDVAESSLIITAAVYSITVALASNNRFYFGFFLVASILESAVYGAAASNNVRVPPTVVSLAGIRIATDGAGGLSDSRVLLIAIGITFISLVIERFTRHIRNREQFFEFMKHKGA
jgi:hypothetical protein